jgi:Holliday junction DNA helicase RuvA
MIDYLNGTLYSKSPSVVVIDVGGVGYEVSIPLSTYEALETEGSKIRLLIYEYIREDAYTLFGFATKAERDFFRMLQNVSGIGPKTALGMISGMNVREIRRAIVERDVKLLTKLPGIGKKTAERLVLELHDKIDPLETLAAEDAPPLEAKYRDAVLALVSLGNPRDIATKIVFEISQTKNPPETTEEIIKKALAPK